jgi:diacylglycerol diphosphate phosphatase/phosphatidate phosphatase
MASPHHILEGRQSFPSGHSSLVFQGMVLIVLYLVGRIGLFALPINSKSSSNNNNNNTAMKLLRTKQLQTLFAVIIPLCYGMFVATSRLVDNWHHPSDIVAGTMIGIGSASLAYHTFYPAVFSKYSGIPYACLVGL